LSHPSGLTFAGPDNGGFLEPELRKPLILDMKFSKTCFGGEMATR
jgi:hypothetical protein